MKVVILAGGLGSRLSEETFLKPKPLVEIGGRPILWHIMKGYSHYGFNEFVICAGYKGYMIKEYFANYAIHNSDITFDIRGKTIEFHNNQTEPWIVTVVDTGQETMTGGRLKRVQRYLNDETFCLTYGDGVSDIHLRELVNFHALQGKHATVTAVQPSGRFGALNLDGTQVKNFQEKPLGDGGWINGGFFVLEPAVFDLLEGDDTVWENEPLETLASDGQLSAYKHDGFWHAMDTLRDKTKLDKDWDSGIAPWKVWQDFPPMNWKQALQLPGEV